MKKKSLYLISLAILANIFLANFALAQTAAPTPPPATDPALSITKADIEGVGSLSACKTLSDKLLKVSTGKYRAIWGKIFVADGSVQDSCEVAPADWPVEADGISGNTDNLPLDTNIFVRSIHNGTGVTQQGLVAAQAQANSDKNAAGPFSTLVGYLLVPLIGVVNAVLAGIVALAGSVFSSVVDPIIHITAMPTVVTTGWTIIRDICNMAFILIMIVMAIATILGLEEYDYKELLRKVVIMALLVNFSMVIAVTIMNAVNFLAAVFWNGQGLTEIASTLLKIVNPFGDFQVLNQGGGVSSELALGLGRTAYMLVSTVVFVALAGMFVIRLVGLYVLIIFSPIAYVARILPATEEFSEEWWSHFLKYLIWAPVALFMLRLVTLVVNNSSQFNLKDGGNHDSVFVYFILTAFMAAALLVAEEAGMVGGHMIVEGVKEGLGELGAGVTGLIGRSYTKRITQGYKNAKAEGSNFKAGLFQAAQFLRPKIAKEAWEQRTHHLTEEIDEPAIAYGHDMLNRVMPTEWHGWGSLLKGDASHMTLGRKTQFGEMESNRVINKKVKEINEAPLTEKQRVQLYRDATHLDDKIAAYRSIVMNNHQDGLAEAAGLDVDGVKGAYDPVLLRKMVFDDLVHAGANKEAAGQESNYVGELSEANKKLRDLGAGLESDEDGKARATVDLTAVNGLGDDKIVEYLQRINVINDKKEFVNYKGEKVGVITSKKDYDNLMASTASNSTASGKNLEYEVMSARGAKEAGRRARRMDNEDIAKAIEPASVAVQYKGNWTRLSSQGRRFQNSLSPSVGVALPGMRRTQGRVQALVGMIQKDDGTHDYNMILTDDPGTTNNPRLDILVEMAHESPEIAAGLLTKGRMSKDVALRIAERVNERLVKDYTYTKTSTKFISVGSEKEGGVEIKITDDPKKIDSTAKSGTTGNNF